MLTLLFLILGIRLFSLADEKTIVLTTQGPVIGYKDKHFNISVFKNIPYATVPKGEHRFKAPLPPPSWEEPYDAAYKEIICPQGPFMDYHADNLVMQEECLVVTVYVPNTKEENIPVVVYVHGGAFVIGFGNAMVPKSLVNSQRIVAVTFNYRLGAHGFLCLGTDNIPGNAGMKDQVALLVWVQKNIAAFGGNPKNVTIAGYSAGSSSVDILMLSKTAEGLFHRVIPESGANTAAFSIQSDPIENAKVYAKMLGLSNVDNIHSLERFFKNATLELLNYVNTLKRFDSTFLMSPCVEKRSKQSFLEDNPVHILTTGNFKKLPMLYGFSNMEGLFRIEFFDVWKDAMNTNFSDFLPADLLYKDTEEKEQIAHTIKQFYFGEDSIDENSVLAYVDYFTDVIFAYPTLRSVKLQVEAGNNEIYLYEFSYVDEDTPYVPYTKVRGAKHCAQTSTILDSDVFKLRKGGTTIKDTMRNIWLNFITTGKPMDSNIPVWPSVGRDRSPYMSLNETSVLRRSLLEKRFHFWDQIYDKYYRWPIAPVWKPVK